MSLEIYPARPTDARELTKVFYGSFHSDLDTAMFPNAPDVTEWWEEYFTTSITRSIAGETHDVFLKVAEGSEDGGIVAFAKWKLPVPAADRRRNEEQIVWPPSSDKDLCDRFFSGMGARHEKWMGDRPHYCTFFFLSFSSLLRKVFGFALCFLYSNTNRDLKIWICWVFTIPTRARDWARSS
jgi:hypothetical protein